MIFSRQAAEFTKLSRGSSQNFPRKTVGPSDDVHHFVSVFLALLDFILLTATYFFSISI